MIADLISDCLPQSLEADVCVVGGPVGITLALALSRGNARVILLESGGRKAEPAFLDHERSKAELKALMPENRPCSAGSAAFMSACNYAAMGAISMEELEAIAREYPNGCAGKYLEGGRDRLQAEIARCFAKR